LNSDDKPLRFCSDRLKSLMQTLQIANAADFTPIMTIAEFVTLIGTYGRSTSFAVIFEPYHDRLRHIPDPVLHLACLDASLVMEDVFERFQTVVLTSGTISPLSFYSKILGFTPVVAKSFAMTLQRKCICPMIITKGPDQIIEDSCPFEWNELFLS